MSIRMHFQELQAKAVRRLGGTLMPAPEMTPAAPKVAASIKKHSNKLLRNNSTPAETARAVEIASFMADTGEMSAAPYMIESNMTLSEVKNEVARRQSIRAAVAGARKSNPTIGCSIAEQYIAREMTVSQVEVELLQMLGPNAEQTLPKSDHGWGAAIAAVSRKKL